MYRSATGVLFGVFVRCLSPPDFSLTVRCFPGVLLLGTLCFVCDRAAPLSAADLSRSTCGLRSGDRAPVLVEVLPPAVELLEVPTRT